MDEYRMEQDLGKVPYEIRDAVMSLSNKKNWAIYIALAKVGEMRFNEIKDHFGSDKSPEIDRALKALLQGGLIEKVAHDPEEIGNAHKTYYAVSEMGIRFLGSLGDMLSPEPQKVSAHYVANQEEIIPIVMEQGKSPLYRRGYKTDTARSSRKSDKKPVIAARKSR